MLKFKFSLFVVGLLISLGGAKANQVKELDSTGVKFHLHTERNRNQSQVIQSNVETIIRSAFYAPDPTVFSIPRWLGSYETPENKAVLEAQLSQRNCNVIITDLSESISIAAAGREIAEFIIFLYQHFAIEMSKVHIVGFSDGAHLAGIVGQYVQQEINLKLQHITALDPSSTMPSLSKELHHHNDDNDDDDDDDVKEFDKQLLSRDDAQFIEVIHTNAGQYGLESPCGHVDYYPNGGRQQPRCIGLGISDSNMCSHERSYQLAKEMWSQNNEFISATCGSIEQMSSTNCRWLSLKMGQNNLTHGIFYLETNGIAPYGKGSTHITFL